MPPSYRAASAILNDAVAATIYGLAGLIGALTLSGTRRRIEVKPSPLWLDGWASIRRVLQLLWAALKNMITRLAGTYPLRFNTRVLYSDMDGFRHLNNVATGRCFFERRAHLNVQTVGSNA